MQLMPLTSQVPLASQESIVVAAFNVLAVSLIRLQLDLYKRTNNDDNKSGRKCASCTAPLSIIMFHLPCLSSLSRCPFT